MGRLSAGLIVLVLVLLLAESTAAAFLVGRAPPRQQVSPSSHACPTPPPHPRFESCPTQNSYLNPRAPDRFIRERRLDLDSSGGTRSVVEPIRLSIHRALTPPFIHHTAKPRITYHRISLIYRQSRHTTGAFARVDDHGRGRDGQGELGAGATDGGSSRRPQQQQGGRAAGGGG